MQVTTTINENIRLAQRAETTPYHLPFSSFAQFFHERVTNPQLGLQTFLTYYDDDAGIRRTYTYAEFGDLVARAVIFMQEGLGIRPGDRIATFLFNHDHTVVIYFAAWVLGATIIPVNHDESHSRKRYILEHSEACCAFCWASELEDIRDLSRDLPHIRHVVSLDNDSTPFLETLGRPDIYLPQTGSGLSQEALIVYTSGTTGLPKGVVLTVENLLMDADGISTWHGFAPGDCLMCVLPIHHVNGIVVTLITPFYFKGRAVLNRRFRRSAFWPRIQEEGVSCVSVVPTLLEFLLMGPRTMTLDRLDHFRGVICGAGPLTKNTAARFEDQFHYPIRHGYGLSETTCYSSFLPVALSGNEHRHWLRDFEFPSIGLPIPHNDMAILDAQGHLLPPMEKGEICIRGQTVCSGYLKQPEANEETFQWGWFRSGDEGFCVQDDQGRPFFFISGRLKELIIRGGVNISPLEIDEALRGHPFVKFAMALSFDHQYYGEEIAGYLVLKEGIARPSESDIIQFCRKRLPFSKCPKVIVFGEEIPFTTTGKPKRLELKTQLRPVFAQYYDVRFKDSLS